MFLVVFIQFNYHKYLKCESTKNSFVFFILQIKMKLGLLILTNSHRWLTYSWHSHNTSLRILLHWQSSKKMIIAHIKLMKVDYILITSVGHSLFVYAWIFLYRSSVKKNYYWKTWCALWIYFNLALLYFLHSIAIILNSGNETKTLWYMKYHIWKCLDVLFMHRRTTMTKTATPISNWNEAFRWFEIAN